MAKRKNKINNNLLNGLVKTISKKDKAKQEAIKKAKEEELRRKKEEEDKRRLEEEKRLQRLQKEREKELQESIENAVMSQVKLRVKAISPLHIGSGKEYTPTNFIIEDNNLYSFSDEDLLNILSDIELKKFINIATLKSADSFARLNKYIKENLKEKVKSIANAKIPTTKGISDDYEAKVGEIVQYEGNNKKVFNEFVIQETQKMQIKDNNYKSYAYIPGSSFKGAISTAYREFIYKNDVDGEEKVKELFENPRNMKNLLFKYFKVSDSIIINLREEIGYACNRERFEDDDTGPFTLVETIQPNSKFEITISYDKDKINFENIIKACNEHYMPIFTSMFEDGDVGKLFNDNFYSEYKKLDLKNNQFLIRVGKYSGARAVTIDGMRDIAIRESKNYVKKHQKEETTTWLYGNKSDSKENLLPFGWVLCEVIK